MATRCAHCHHAFYTDSDSEPSQEIPGCKICLGPRADYEKILAETNAELEDVTSERTFLTLPFDSEPTDNRWKGDAVIVVQGNTKEQVYAHKFILVRNSGLL